MAKLDARRLQAFLADPGAAHRRAEAARALVAERYSWDHLGARLARVVAEIVPAEARK